MDGITQALVVVICNDADDAIEQGHTYADPATGFKAVEITRAVVIKDGMQSGNASVDLVMQDAEGNKYVAMISAALLKSIPTTF